MWCWNDVWVDRGAAAVGVGGVGGHWFLWGFRKTTNRRPKYKEIKIQIRTKNNEIWNKGTHEKERMSFYTYPRWCKKWPEVGFGSL